MISVLDRWADISSIKSEEAVGRLMHRLKCVSYSRYDLADLSLLHFQQMITFQSGAIALFIYLASLILTLATTKLDDKLSLHRSNETIFQMMDKQARL